MIYKCLCLWMLCCVNLTPPEVDEVIEWRDNLKLTWGQFKGTPKTNNSAAALTASGISFEFSVKQTENRIIDFNTKVQAHFYPNKSWYIKEKSDAAILAHEQLHFDITELYARKFRKQIAQLQVSNNLKAELQALNQKIVKQLNVAQNRYDKETNNSTNIVLQAKWNNDVKAELAQLIDYKSKA
ncbi:MAG: DUF922 domain-containing protein [Aquaticitalea sp.]